MAFTVMAECGAMRAAERQPQSREHNGRPHPRCRRRSHPAASSGGDGEAIRLRRGRRGVGRNGAGAPPGARPASGQSRHSRPRHARPRWDGRARTPAQARHRRAGDRADGARLDRSRDLGDARGGDRLRGEARRRGAPAGVDQERAASRRARGRIAPGEPPQRRRARLPRHRQPRRNRWPAPCAWPSAPPSRTSPC